MSADFLFGLTAVNNSADAAGDWNMPTKDVPIMFDRKRRRSLVNPISTGESERVFNPDMGYMASSIYSCFIRSDSKEALINCKKNLDFSLTV